MGKIILENIRVYAYHGCLAEETIIGSDYRVDLMVETDLSPSALSDDLKDTVDYVHLNQIVKDEMAIASKLLEHVCQRIINRVGTELKMVEEIIIKVSKINPPIGGDVAMVSVEMKQSFR